MVRRLFLAAILIGLPLFLMSNTLTKAYVRGDRLLLDFSQPIDLESFHTFRLVKSGSVRYVFDLKHTRLGSSRVPLGLHHPGVASFRISQYRADTVRIVVETSKTYRMLHGRRASRLYSIRLPYTPSDAQTIGKLFANVTTPKASSSSAPKSRVRTKPKRSKAIPKARLLHPAPPKPPRHRYTVILDPGHGGHDTGAIGGRKREKVLVLQVSKRVRKYLKRMGIRVLMTRSSDRFVKLRNRTRYANRKHGDVFVSIHANAIAGRKRLIRHGVETFFLQTTRSERAKRVAARENSVVLRRSDRLSKNVILNSVMTGPKIVLSNKLAIDVQRHTLGNLRRKYNDVLDGGVRPAPFWVLVGAEMPAVLVEIGYISYSKERKRLFTPAYQELIAKGIAEGVANYLRNREREME
jgi:N-acetylmuramoyl-L-alanine amidase